jgi:4a-hydroxytetrahydrobiopterin dehydratase
MPGWTRQGDAIERTFTFRSFMESVAFVNDVAKLSEQFDHHPDIDVRYKQVVLRYTTWEGPGITERDFEMAKRAERLAVGSEDEEDLQEGEEDEEDEEEEEAKDQGDGLAEGEEPDRPEVEKRSDGGARFGATNAEQRDGEGARRGSRAQAFAPGRARSRFDATRR